MSTSDYLRSKYWINFNQPSPIEIPNVGRLDLIRWFKELNFRRGVEIGVDHGDFSKLICDQNTQMRLFGVDPYLKYDEYHEYESQAQMDGIYEFAKKRMAVPIARREYVLLRKTSMEALEDFADGSLDFVYIDGNHEADFPYQDIVGWTKKVRSGGIVAGHDFVRIKALDFTIKDGVMKYVEENKISPWFILGSYQVRTREVRDRSRSWMFIKP